MSVLNQWTFFGGKGMYPEQPKTTCVNCGSEIATSAEAIALPRTVHTICPNCHEYSNVYVKDKIKKKCPHCWRTYYFEKDENNDNCHYCGKKYTDEVSKEDKKSNITFFEVKTPLHGTISKTYL